MRRGRKKEKKKTFRKRKKKEEREEKPAVGPMHADPAAIMAPAHCLMGPAYWGIAGGIACEVPVHGRGPGLISMMFPCPFLHIPSNVPVSGAYCCVYSICPPCILESC